MALDDEYADNEVADILTGSKMHFLEIKEVHPVLNREVTRHKFPGSHGIDIVILPATPRHSPVHGPKPVITKQPEDVDKVIGDSVTFELVVEDETGVSVSWFKDKTLLLGSGRHKIWKKGKYFYFKIENLKLEDESVYECVVRNENGEVKCDVQLLVDEEEFDDEESDDEVDSKVVENINRGKPPTFIKNLKKEYILLCGESLELKVEVDGYPKPEITWFYEDQKIQADKFIQLRENGTTFSLYIPETILDDEGVYKISAKNSHGEIFTDTDVLVDEKEDETMNLKDSNIIEKNKKDAPKFIKTLESLTIKEGNTGKFCTDIESESDVVVTWYKGEEPINNIEDSNMVTLAINNSHSLIIGNVKLYDASLYTCKAVNKYGEASCTAELLVMPDLPEIMNGEQRDSFNCDTQKLDEEVSPTSIYVVTEDYELQNHALELSKGTAVEVIDCSQSDKWLVRLIGDTSVVGFIAPNVLKK